MLIFDVVFVAIYVSMILGSLKVVNEEDKKKMRDALLIITKGSTRLYDTN